MKKIVFICLILVTAIFGLSACSAGSASTAAATPKPSPTPGCAGQTVYRDPQNRFCFSYPAGYQWDHEWLIGPALDKNTPPTVVRFSVQAETVDSSRTLNSLISDFLNQYTATNNLASIRRSSVELNGAQAEQMEPVPGLLDTRVVLALHNGTYVRLLFQPAGQKAASKELEALYKTVVKSFIFLK